MQNHFMLKEVKVQTGARLNAQSCSDNINNIDLTRENSTRERFANAAWLTFTDPGLVRVRIVSCAFRVFEGTAMT